MYDLTNFTLQDMTKCGSTLRGLADGAQSMEEAAGKIVQHLYEQCGDGESGEKGCVLVRCYKTHTLGHLPENLQAFARAGLGEETGSSEVKCLTLLATVGKEDAWNDRLKSKGHQAIPLPSTEAVSQIPMIAQLVKQFGLEVSALVERDTSLLVDREETSFNVFYVREALGSPYIPAQEDFVIPFGVKSVLGFGGVLPAGDLFAIILFSTVSIPEETAKSFESLALSAKLALLPFSGGQTFN